MTQERLITSRNLIDSDVGPLRRLTGILDSMPVENRPEDKARGYKASVQVTLNLKDIEVLEAIEPYPFPIFSPRPLTLSNRRKSMWGVLADSFNAIADMQYTKEQLDPTNPNYIKPSARPDIYEAIGKRVGMVMADGEEGRPKPPELFDGRANDGKGGDVPRPCWTFYMVEGLGQIGTKGVTPLEKAMQLLDGHTLAEFNALAMMEHLIRGDVQLLQSIGMPPSAKASFSSTMLTSKQFTKDQNEVFHRIQPAG